MLIECNTCGSIYRINVNDDEDEKECSVTAELMQCIMCCKQTDEIEDDEVEEIIKTVKPKKINIPEKQSKYTPEIIERIKQVINKKTKNEITDLLRLEFGLNISVPSLNNALWRRGITCTNQNNKNIQSVKKYTEEHFDWIRDNIDSTKDIIELLEKFNEEFNMDVTQGALQCQMSLNKIKRNKIIEKMIVEKEPVVLIDPHQKEIEEKEKRQRKGMSKEAIEIIEDNYMSNTDDELREMIADKTSAFHGTDKIENYRESNGMARPGGWEPMEDDDDN